MAGQNLVLKIQGHGDYLEVFTSTFPPLNLEGPRLSELEIPRSLHSLPPGCVPLTDPLAGSQDNCRLLRLQGIGVLVNV